VAAVAAAWRQCGGGGGGSAAAAATLAQWRWRQRQLGHHAPPRCNKDTDGNSDGRGTYNNQQLTKRSGNNSDENGNDDSGDNDN
jgi:hypothetical protein